MFPDLIQILSAFLVPVVIVTGVVYGILSLKKKKRTFVELDTGIGSIKLLYFYTVTFVALMMASSGITEIAHYILDAITDTEIDGPSRIRLATGLSLTTVGVPLWAFHWNLITKQIKNNPLEKRSLIRKIYFYLVLAISLVILIGAAITVFQWIMNNRPFSGYSTASILIWAVVWIFHWRVESDEGQLTPEIVVIRRLYIYLVATITLIIASTAAGMLLAGIMSGIYDALTSIGDLARPDFWNPSTKTLLSFILIPGTTWAGHWLYFARSDYDSILRQLYIYGISILGSIVALLLALSVMIYGVLVWVLGVPDDTSASSHFGFLPAALASVLVGSSILTHHWHVAKREEDTSFLQSRRAPRSFPYVVAMIGLIMLSVATVTTVSISIGLLVESAEKTLTGSAIWRNQIMLVFTLGLLGAPLWGYCWFHPQRQAKESELEIQNRIARRNFSLAVSGIGMVSLAACISFSLFVFLRELLDGNLSEVLPATKVSLGVIVAAGIFVPYHWMVYKRDRYILPELKARKETPHLQKSITVLANLDGADFVSRLETNMGCDINALTWVDNNASFPKLQESDIQKLAQGIREANGPNILLIPDNTTIRILSYR